MGQLFSRNEEPLRSSPYKPSPLPPKPTSSSSKRVPKAQPFNRPLSIYEILTAHQKPSLLLTKPETSLKPTPSFNQTLSPAPPNSVNQQRKASYEWVEKATSPLSFYDVPTSSEAAILSRKEPLLPPSPSTTSSKAAAQAAILPCKPSGLPHTPSTSSPESLNSSSLPSPSMCNPPTSSNKSDQLLSMPANFLAKPSSSLPPTSVSSSNPSPQTAISSCKAHPSSPSPSTSSSKPAPQAAIWSSKTSTSPHTPSTSSLNPFPQATSFSPPPSLSDPQTSTAKPSPSSPNPATFSSRPFPYPSKASPSSLPSIKQPPSFKTTMYLASSNSTDQENKASCIGVEKGTSPIYAIPKDVKGLIEKETLPPFIPYPSLLNPVTPPSSSEASPSPSSSSKQPPSFKPTLSLASSNSTNQQKKIRYICVPKGMSPIFSIPEDIKGLIKREKVPDVLKKPLSPSTFKDFFAALLYAEDFYIEKWNDFQLKNITLKLQEAAIYKKSERETYFSDRYERDDKNFVAFEIDSVPEKLPFLLSRDFVFAQPLGRETEPFQGIIYRVRRSTCLLVEFGEDFHSQHLSTHKYDVSFSFNRVCLKRAHQSIEASSDPLFRSFLFPDCILRKIIASPSPPPFFNHNLDVHQRSAVHAILSFQGSPPYLVEGPICVTNVKKNRSKSKHLTRTGLVVQEVVLQICLSSPKHRILICAPNNSTCDVLMQSLMNEIPESDIFRANAAFRDLCGIPDEILLSCAYEGECFTCPPRKELQKFTVILSTFTSSFRLHSEGLAAGHFSHIFLVDASSATEPEAMVALANFACEKTTVIVTGAPGNRSGWVRSDIARKNGLRISYFERLRDRKPYSNLDPMFITQLVHSEHI